METVFFARIDSGFDFGNILPHRGADVARFGKEILGKFRNVAAGNAESVMHHEDLPVGDIAAPMPITGMVRASVMRFASSPARTPGPTAAHPPPPALTRLQTGSAPHRRDPALYTHRIRSPTAASGQDGRKPGTARSASILTVSASQAPPSSLTILAPARITMAAFAKVCSGGGIGHERQVGKQQGCLARRGGRRGCDRRYLPR
ncbi:Uncharacterised protein [Klebsiella pneumoniae subsp. pneumoniae]|nr:Uncharacterised protein [Klebsiella pneumoniae subsp. pneumoniae]